MSEDRHLYSIYEITIRYDDYNTQNNYSEFKSLFYGSQEEIDKRIYELNKVNIDKAKDYIINKIGSLKNENEKYEEKRNKLLALDEEILLEPSIRKISDSINWNNQYIIGYNITLNKINDGTYIFDAEGHTYFESRILTKSDFDNFSIIEDKIQIHTPNSSK